MLVFEADVLVLLVSSLTNVHCMAVMTLGGTVERPGSGLARGETLLLGNARS